MIVAGLNNWQEDPALDSMRLMEPEPVPFSMDTPGWQILGIITALLLLYIAFKYYRHYKANAYRRAAIIKVSQAKNKANPIKEVMFILKQTALSTYPRDKVAALEGDAWLAFLDAALKEGSFINYKAAITAAVYQEETETVAIDLDAFLKLSINWIQKHG